VVRNELDALAWIRKDLTLMQLEAFDALIQRLARLERVREAADKVAAYLTLEAEFSGDEADHSGLYELDAALGAIIATESA
jgi:hypothetical protein